MEISEIFEQDHRPAIPELNCEEPEDEEWLMLHRQALGIRDTLGEMKFRVRTGFMFEDPEIGGMVLASVQRLSGGSYEITASVLELESGNPLAALQVLQPEFEQLVSTPDQRYLRVALGNKKELSKHDLALRERLGIPSPGRKAGSWPRFREKWEGFDECPLSRKYAGILSRVLMLAERLLAAKEPRQIYWKSFAFTLKEGAQPDRPASWQMNAATLRREFTGLVDAHPGSGRHARRGNQERFRN